MHNCEKCSIFCLHCQRLFSADFRTSTVLKCRPVKWAERGIDFCSFISDRLKPHLSSAISNSLSKATLLETQWASFLVYLHLSKKTTDVCCGICLQKSSSLLLSCMVSGNHGYILFISFELISKTLTSLNKYVDIE